MRHMSALAITLSLVLGTAEAGESQAAACRDAKGKFVACPAQPQRCRGPSGAFAKCGTPGAKPIAAAKTTTLAKTASIAKTAPTKH